MMTLFAWKKILAFVIVLICGANAIVYSKDWWQTPPVHIQVSPERDIAPSEVRLRVATHLDVPVETIAWDFQGDGTYDVQGPHMHSQTVTYAKGGHYSPRVVVTDKQGDTFEAKTQVVIAEPDDLEAALNSRWSEMLTALAQQDIEGALSFVATSRRGRMRHDWTALKDHLEKLAHTFNVPLQLTDGRGLRVVAKSTAPLPMGEIQFPLEVVFVWESDNQWHIKSY